MAFSCFCSFERSQGWTLVFHSVLDFDGNMRAQRYICCRHLSCRPAHEHVGRTLHLVVRNLGFFASRARILYWVFMGGGGSIHAQSFFIILGSNWFLCSVLEILCGLVPMFQSGNSWWRGWMIEIDLVFLVALYIYLLERIFFLSLKNWPKKLLDSKLRRAQPSHCPRLRRICDFWEVNISVVGDGSFFTHFSWVFDFQGFL